MGHQLPFIQNTETLQCVNTVLFSSYQQLVTVVYIFREHTDTFRIWPLGVLVGDSGAPEQNEDSFSNTVTVCSVVYYFVFGG